MTLRVGRAFSMSVIEPCSVLPIVPGASVSTGAPRIATAAACERSMWSGAALSGPVACRASARPGFVARARYSGGALSRFGMATPAAPAKRLVGRTEIV